MTKSRDSNTYLEGSRDAGVLRFDLDPRRNFVPTITRPNDPVMAAEGSWHR